MLAHQTLGVRRIGVGEDDLPGGTDLLTPATMDDLEGQQPDSAVTVHPVIPAEEAPTEGPGILDPGHGGRPPHGQHQRALFEVQRAQGPERAAAMSWG